MSRIEELGAVVVGVSPDTVADQKKFQQKYDLPFTLLADEKAEAATAYGVWQEKKNFGRTYMGVVRSTFVIDEEGRVQRAFRNVKVEGHVEDVIGVLEGLN